MDEEWFKISREADREGEIPFFCKTGQLEAKLNVYIEPDPHGDGKGSHAHFHTIIHCPKIEMVEVPEPDRCELTNETCPFVEPLGGYQRNSATRKWVDAQRFLHNLSSVEFRGMQLIYAGLRSRGFDIAENGLPELRFVDIIRFIRSLSLLDKDTCDKLDVLRKKRNTLAHGADEYLKFEEKELYVLAARADDLGTLLNKRIHALGSSTKP